jgi:type IV fimbrial biogenesis protein FimT
MNGQQLGLTLIELMVTLAVAIILLAIGIPAFQGMEANSRGVSYANALLSSMTLARTEAMGRGVPVAVCPNKSAAGSAPECGAAGDWAKGWFVFADPTGTGTTPGAAAVIRTFNKPVGEPTVTTSAAMIRFGPDGLQRPRNNDPPVLISMTSLMKGAPANQTRVLCVTPTGNSRVERGTTCP